MERKIVEQTFIRFLLPTLAGSLVLSVISMTDLIIAGRFVGEEALAAISLALPVSIFVMIVSALFGIGGSIRIAILLGEGQLEESSRVFTLALIGTACTGLLTSVLGLVFLRPLIVLLGGGTGAVLSYASQYIGTLLAGIVLMMLSPVMLSFLRNDNEQRYSFLCVTVQAISNLVLSLFFAAGLRLGIFGIALATVLSQLISCALASIRLFSPKRTFRLVRGSVAFKRLITILSPGLPVAVIFASQILLTVMVNQLLMEAGGSNGVAAYAIVKYLINFLFALFDGVTGSIQPMLGVYYGEREKQNIRDTVRISFFTMIFVAAVMCLLMEAGGDLLFGLFHVTSPELRRVTHAALRILGPYCLVCGLITYINAFYRCTGKNRISFLLSMLDNLVFPIGGVLILVRMMGLGVIGVWTGLLCAGCLTVLVWLILCLVRGKGFLMLEPNDFRRPEGELHLVCEARSEEVGQLLSQVEVYCDEHEIPVKKAYYINLSIEELVVNVVRMAEAAHVAWRRNFYYVDVNIMPRPDGQTVLRIRDNLTAFNPGALQSEDLTDADTEDGADGVNVLGIAIVQRIAAEYSYKRTIGFNNFFVVL